VVDVTGAALCHTRRVIEFLVAAAFCTAPQLGATLELQGATGSLRGGALVHNRGRTCIFRPTGVTVERPGSGTDVTTWEPGFRLVLPRGRTAWLPIVWRNWCGAPPTRFSLQLGGGAILVVRPTAAPRCDVAGQPTEVHVGRARLR
jgi:hypothetical protein